MERLPQLEHEAAAGKVMGSNAGVTPPATPQLKRANITSEQSEYDNETIMCNKWARNHIDSVAHASPTAQQLPTDLDEKKGGMDTSMTTTAVDIDDSDNASTISSLSTDSDQPMWDLEGMGVELERDIEDAVEEVLRKEISQPL